MSLSSKEYKAILDTIDLIYSVSDKSAMFKGVVRRLQKLIPIHSAIFVPTDIKTGEFLFNGYETYNNPEKVLLTYLTCYAPQDPFITSGWFEKSFNVVKRNTDITPEPQLIRSEFACDFLLSVADHILYGVACTIASQGDKVGCVGFHRHKRDGDFTDRDKKIVNYILPHMAHAIRDYNLMEGFDPAKESYGVVAVGEDGKAFYMNGAAKKALNNRPVTVIPDPGNGAFPVFFISANVKYRVRTVYMGMKMRGRFILMESHPPENKLYPKLAEFKLSRREEEVAVLVVQGMSNRDIAESLFIAEQTVKDHLRSVYEKAGVHKRNELTVKVMGIASFQKKN